MPTILKSEKDKEDLENQQNSVSQPVIGAPNQAELPSGGTSVAQSNTAPKSSGFVGIQQYLKQNEPQSEKLAQQVGSGVQGEINKADEQIKNVGSQFEAKVKEQEQVFNPNLVQKAQSAPEALSQAEKQQLINQRQATYEGVKGLEQTDLYQPMQEQVAKAQQQAKYVSSDEGRKTLLKNIQDRRASQGITNLNNLLIGGSQKAQNVMESLTQGASDLDTRLKAASEAAQARAQQAAATTKQTAQDITTGLNTAYDQFKSQIDANTVLAQKQANDRNNAIRQALSQGQIQSDYLGDLGITQAQANLIQEKLPLIGNDLSRFSTFTPAENVIGRNQAATAEDFARQQALLDLTGRADSYINESLKSDGRDLTDFNYDAAKQVAFDKEVQAKSNELEGLYNQILINPMLMNQLNIFSPQAARNYVNSLKSQYVSELTQKYNV